MSAATTRVVRLTGVALIASFLLAFEARPAAQTGDVFGVQTGGRAQTPEETRLRALERSCQDRKRAAGQRLNAELDRCHTLRDDRALNACRARASDVYAAEGERINAECKEQEEKLRSEVRSNGGGAPPRSGPPAPAPPPRSTRPSPSPPAPTAGGQPAPGDPQVQGSRPAARRLSGAPAQPSTPLSMPVLMGACSAGLGTQQKALADALRQVQIRVAAPVEEAVRKQSLRLASDSVSRALTAMGFQYLAANAAPAVTALASATGGALGLSALRNWLIDIGGRGAPLPAPVPTKPQASPAPQTSPAPPLSGPQLFPQHRPLPPGFQVPSVLRTTPRPVYQQTEPCSCGLACMRMVVDTVERRPLPEAAFRQALDVYYDPTRGTEITRLADGLRTMGIRGMPVSMNYGRTLDDLARATQTGYPAIAHVGHPVSGHFVVVDAVIGTTPGNRIVLVRDPVNPALLDPIIQQGFRMLGFTNQPWYTEQEFMQAFNQGGAQAIFTRP